MCGSNLKFVCLVFFLQSAVGAIAAPLATEKNSTPSAYSYEAKNRRDPFVQPQAGRLRNVMEKVEIENLKLTGIIRNPQRSLALFVSQTGPQFGYLLKNEKLYQENHQPVPGVMGEVVNSEKVILKQGDKQIVYSLHAN